MTSLGKLTLILAADNARLRSSLNQSENMIRNSARKSGGFFEEAFQGIFQGIGQNIANQAIGVLTNGLRAIKGAVASSVGEFVSLESQLKILGVIAEVSTNKFPARGLKLISCVTIAL